MKKLCSVLALALVLCMLCSCALANEQMRCAICIAECSFIMAMITALN